MIRTALLLGDPVAHSLSPLIHNTAFRAAGIEAVYHAVRTPPHALPAAVAGLRHEAVLGANITIPHKSAVVDLVDELDETAAAVGAVNTVVRAQDGSLVGFNTDVGGFLAPLRIDELDGGSALIMGSGGAARAVAYALIDRTRISRLVIAARRPDAAARILEDLRATRPLDLKVESFRDVGGLARDADLIVNATPVGMHPVTAESPLPEDAFRSGQLVYDLVYNPRPTRLLAHAAAAGARTIDGVEMLLGQAAEAFRMWTGVRMPAIPVRKAVLID